MIIFYNYTKNSLLLTKNMQKRSTRQTSKNTHNNSQTTFPRSKSQQKTTRSTVEMCAVCLNEINPADYAALNCKHKFCSVQCAKGWWKFNESCPYCREEIQCIQTKNGEEFSKDDVSERSSEDDDDFKPRCSQCWADIDEEEERKVCCICSSNFIHKRCEMFPSRYWKCNNCIENTDEKGREVYAVIPYNPILHYLVMQNLARIEK